MFGISLYWIWRTQAIFWVDIGFYHRLIRDETSYFAWFLRNARPEIIRYRFTLIVGLHVKFCLDLLQHIGDVFQWITPFIYVELLVAPDQVTSLDGATAYAHEDALVHVAIRFLEISKVRWVFGIL